jgi:tetratricopeptide (TPR) repeat protein
LSPLCSFINQIADSLKHVLSATHVDSSRVRISAAIAFELASENPQEALQFARQAVDISKAIEFKEGEALGYNRMGNCYKQSGKYDSAFYFFKKVIVPIPELITPKANQSHG